MTEVIRNKQLHDLGHYGFSKRSSDSRMISPEAACRRWYAFACWTVLNLGCLSATIHQPINAIESGPSCIANESKSICCTPKTTLFVPLEGFGATLVLPPVARQTRSAGFIISNAALVEIQC